MRKRIEKILSSAGFFPVVLSMLVLGGCTTGNAGGSKQVVAQFLSAMQEGKEWPYTIENDGLGINDFIKQNETLPEDFTSAYQKRVFQSWKIQDVSRVNDNDLVHVRLTTIAPDENQFDQTMNDLKQSLVEQTSQALSENKELEMSDLQQQIQDSIYTQLEAELQNIGTSEVSVLFTVSPEEKIIKAEVKPEGN